MLLYEDMKNRGRFGDTELAHVNPQEMALLQALGGSGTINPFTGRPEFFNPNYWVPPEDPEEDAASNDSGGKTLLELLAEANLDKDTPGGTAIGTGYTHEGTGVSGPLGGIIKSIVEADPPDLTLPTGTGETKPTLREYLQGLGPNIGSQWGLDAGLGEHIERGGWTNWIPTSSAGGQGTKTQESYTDPLIETAENGTTSETGSSSGSSVEGGMTEDQFKEYLFGQMKGEIDTPYEAYDDKKRFSDFDPMQKTAFNKVATFGASTPQEMIDAASAARGETDYTSGYDSGTSTSEFAPGTYTSGYAPTDYTSGYTTAGVDPAAFQKEIDARMSPFTGSVINQLQKDITEQQQLALGQTGEQARASGAFGGSRQGVAEGITSGKYADAFGRTAGQLRADQFNKAVAGADVDRQMKERFGQGAYGLTQQARQAKERFDQGAFGLTAQDRARAESFRQGAFGQTEQARQAEEAANRLAASTRLAAGSELRTTGQALDDAEARRINALAAAGAQKQQLDQALKDFQYNQFVEGRDWDKSNILAGGGLIGAVPPDDPPVYGREGGILNRFMEILFGKNRQIA